MAKRKDYVGIYKPTKNNTGAVAQVKMAADRTCMFLEMAKQVRPKEDPVPYDWKETGICIKLGPTDIGKLLSLLNGTLPLKPGPTDPDLELFHRNAKGNKVIKIKKQQRGYYMKVSAKEDGKQISIAISIAWDEAELVKIALTKGYEIILGW